MGLPAKPDLEALRELFRPHIDSFDYFLAEGLEKAVLAIRPIEITLPSDGSKLRIFFGKPRILPPAKEGKISEPIFPHECRQAGISYRGELSAEVCFQFNEGLIVRDRISFGHVPIMLMSKLCHLRGADPQKLVFHKEEALEMGGYFICNGLERVGRLLIWQKANYPMGMVRKSYCNRGDGYSDKAVVMRCVREDQTSVTIKLYYLHNGSARLGFWIRGRELLLPVGIILKALTEACDSEIFLSLTCSYNERYQRENGVVATRRIVDRSQIILDEVRTLSLYTRSQCLDHIGYYFQPAMRGFENESHAVVAEAVLRDYIFVHLSNNHEKFNLLIFLLQKLFALVDETASPDNPDALQNQDVLLPGHLITVYVKEKLQDWLGKSRYEALEELKKNEKAFDSNPVAQVKKLISRNTAAVGRAVESMIRTGKLATRSPVDLPQVEGMTIQAERLNFLRFISHFRSVHRGSSFARMRTVSVRKLLPESWGFLCPVHTPDGDPCGLLNHMTAACCVTSFFDSEGKIRDFLEIRMSIRAILTAIGMISSPPMIVRAGPPEVLHVLLDGCVVGSIASNIVEEAVRHIRRLKHSPSSKIPADLEVGYVRLSLGGAYPGLYLFTSPSRFVRPVRSTSQSNDKNHEIELIGPFEQVYMEIKCSDGGDGGRKECFPATHEEIHPTRMLSVVANLTPWSDHNQSPRNMYQCQMAKQSMGFSSQALQHRADIKLYHLQTPQSPIVRTATYSKYCLDEFPTGTNAIVAVLAYTGYDMEDAMILNKSSVDRGLCRGHIYQTETIDLTKKHDKSDKVVEIFFRSSDRSMQSKIDSDGLPYVGQRIGPDEIVYSSYNTLTSVTKATPTRKGMEPAFVDYVAVDGSGLKNGMQKSNIRYRRPRNPVIGDKFSSRHGQKGVCSQLWPDVDMPFSANTGMRPDLIINPHAFPSRMTIGMLLESIAAKVGSMSGNFMDATPFCSASDEDKSKAVKSSSVVDELGPILASYGFNYHGLEVLYSGVYGMELTCEIFIGPVYYQRLRHMVSDKFQVRSTGVIDKITRQPIGGRKRGGGVRFGEMERDSVLAHGAAYLLHDRLHTCSDYHIAEVCSYCGSLLTASTIQLRKTEIRFPGLHPAKAPKPPRKDICLACKNGKGLETVAMPYVFRYLAAELAAMNIKMYLHLNDGDDDEEEAGRT